MINSQSNGGRFIRLRLTSVPNAQGQVRVGKVFRISALIETGNVEQVNVTINFEPMFFELINVPQRVELKMGSGSYNGEVEWYIRALSPIGDAKIKIEAKADDMLQIAEYPFIVTESDNRLQIGENDEDT